MINLVSSINDVKLVIAKDFADYLNVEYIERGNEHFVALIDKKYVARFPRNQKIAINSNYVDNLLSRLKNSPLFVPNTLYKKDNPLYFVSDYINGNHLTAEQVKALSKDKKKDLAYNYSKFAANLHVQFNIKKESFIQQKYGLSKNRQLSWQDYFSKAIYNRKFPNQKQDLIAKRYFNIWQSNKGSTPLVLLHDDLHLENILFLNNKLVGILDFGDVNIGYPEQEFRQLYKLGDDILIWALQHYNLLTGRNLEPNTVKNWAIMQQLASYSERWFNNEMGHPAFARACEDLGTWLPEGKWGVNL